MQSKSDIYIGIDPGYSVCGIAVVASTSGELVYYTHLENWTPQELYNIITTNIKSYDWNICKVGVENVHTMPGQGVASSGKFMKATGIIIGTLNGMQIPYIEITPQKWKTISTVFLVDKTETKSQKKAKSLDFVTEKYPNCRLHESKLTKKIKIDIADAICIATYMYENNV